jgi:adenylate cyclase
MKKKTTTTAVKKPWSRLPTCSILDDLLVERVEHPERLKAIDTRIKKQFEKKVAILILDMSGFSRLVQRYGILHYLSMIRRMRRIVAPVVYRNKGLIIKFEADNAFAVFPKTDDAVRAAMEINHDLDVANIVTPDESDIYTEMGIGYGTTLLACDDLYGNEMNLACKLGEDTAEKREVLLTSAARKNCKTKIDAEPFELTISGVTMTAYKLKA